MSELTESTWPIPRVDVLGEKEGRDRAILQSSLWAASGDALGWITELSKGVEGVLRRTGGDRVTRPVAWRRVVGGRGGPQIFLPAGTYSDDTQLRLAVSRSIRGDGSFDVEAFAKIEMTVWPTYALGAGRGSKLAAANLARGSVNWFSNFYKRGAQEYVLGGGNGAAMRVQPHVWAFDGDSETLILNVLRNAIVTHGHPHGFCGAIFHALCVDDVIRGRIVPTPDSWGQYLDRCLDIGRLIESEPQLATFWVAEWEMKSGVTLKDAIVRFRDEGHRDIELVQSVGHGQPLERYREVLGKLGCLTPQYRGSGWKTALAALSLAYLFRNEPIEDALIAAVNELESDTDTIATMAGALLGATVNRIPKWPLQDYNYLISEAYRLSSIARGENQYSFPYPDLGRWNPPGRQSESIGMFGDQLAIAGLGDLHVQSEEYPSNRSVWQWFRLPFGQNILAKRREQVNAEMVLNQLPESRPRASNRRSEVSSLRRETLPASRGLFEDDHIGDDSVESSRRSDRFIQVTAESLDIWTKEVISSNFDDRVLGRMLNRCIDTSHSVENAIGFSAIIAKAKLARLRRRR